MQENTTSQSAELEILKQNYQQFLEKAKKLKEEKDNLEAEKQKLTEEKENLIQELKEAYQKIEALANADLTLQDAQQKEQSVRKKNETLMQLKSSLQKKEEELKKRESSLNSKAYEIHKKEEGLETTITAYKREALTELAAERIAVNQEKADNQKERQELNQYKAKCKKEAEEKAQTEVSELKKELEEQKIECKQEVDDKAYSMFLKYFGILVINFALLMTLLVSMLYLNHQTLAILFGKIGFLIKGAVAFVKIWELPWLLDVFFSGLMGLSGFLLCITVIFYGYLPAELWNGDQFDWAWSIFKCSAALFLVITNIFEAATTANLIIGFGI